MTGALVVILLTIAISCIPGYSLQYNDNDSDGLSNDIQSEGTWMDLQHRTKRDATDFLAIFSKSVGTCWTGDHQRTCNAMCQETQKRGGICYCGGRCGWYRWRRECRCSGDDCPCR